MMDNSLCVWKNFRVWDTLFLVVGLSLLGISDTEYSEAVYLYPLADNTGTAEVVHGGTRGYDGLGDVTAFDVKPPPGYKALYFHGTDSSFVELKVGEQTHIESDWSIAMYVYSTAPRRGTVFDAKCENAFELNSLLASRIQLKLDGPHAALTILWGDENDTVDFNSVFAAHEWVSLAIVYDSSNGIVSFITNDIQFHTTINVKNPLPAKIKLGGTYGTSDPFEGSVACFAVYNSILCADNFEEMKKECDKKQKETKNDNFIGFGLQKLKKVYACTLPFTKGGHDSCILFDDIKCGERNRVLIKNALFGFRKANYENCEWEESRCREPKDSGCCTQTEGDELKSLAPSQIKKVSTNCSFSSYCTGFQADTGYRKDEHSSFSAIYYVCQPVEQVVRFCDNGDVSARSISIVFNGPEVEIESSAECVCQLKTTQDANSYRISAPDLRLQTASTRYESGVTIARAGGGNPSTITKMDHFDLSSDNEIQLSFESNPKFVWILIQSTGEGEIFVSCSESTDVLTDTTSLPTVETSETPDADTTLSELSSTTLSTSAASSTLAPDKTTTTVHIHESSTTTSVTQSINTKPTSITTDYSHSEGFVGSGQTSENFPVAAVVIPVVLLLLGAVAGLFVWRRWQRRQSGSKEPIEYENQTPRNHIKTAVQNKAYDTTNQPGANGPMKTANNYIVLDQENTYTYIDHADAQAGLGRNDPERLAVGAAHLQNTPKPSHIKVNSSNNDNKKIGVKPTEQNADDNSEPHNYFVLEPQNSVNADPTYPKNNKTLQSNTIDNEVAQSHDYFVLEHQKPKTETSIQPKATTTRMPGFTETERVKHLKYLASEPQDTYSSIDPDDVIIQTLPENEYNVINMKGKSTISRDPNYGTLETVDQIGNDIEDSGDYSHIGKSPNKKMDMNEYSHT